MEDGKPNLSAAFSQNFGLEPYPLSEIPEPLTGKRREREPHLLGRPVQSGAFL